MMKSKKIQISRMLLLKSGKFAYCNFDLREPVHLSGSNRTGKTSIINAIQFAFIYDMHDGDWDDHDLQATRKHYFGQNSLLAFEFKTASGPKTLLIRGSGPVDGYKPTREFWHGSLNEDRLVTFSEENDPTGIKVREEIEAYLIEMESVPIKTASEFDSFLMNEVQILKKARKKDLTAFRRLFKDILGMSSIQDEDLKKLIIGLWTTPQQREIDLTSDSETFGKLASEQENLRRFESKIDEIKQVNSEYKTHLENLDEVSIQIADILNSMPIYRKEILVKKKGFEKDIDKIIVELKTESELEVKMSDAAGDLRESRGELNHQLKTVEGDIKGAKNVEPNLKFTLLEDEQELRKLVSLRNTEHLATKGDALSTNDRIIKVNRQISLYKNQLSGKKSLHQILTDEDIGEVAISKAARVLNQELLETTPEIIDKSASLIQIKSLISELTGNELHYSGLRIGLEHIKDKKISSIIPLEKAEEEIKKLESEKRTLEADLKILEDAEKLSQQIKSLEKSIQVDTKLLELQDSIEELVESFRKLSNQIKEIDDELTLLKKNIDDSKETQKSLNRGKSATMKLLEDLVTEMELIENQVNRIRSEDGFQNMVSKTLIKSDLISSTIEKTIKSIEQTTKKSDKIGGRFEFIYASLNRSVFFIDSETSFNWLNEQIIQFDEKKNVHHQEIKGFMSSVTDRLSRFVEGKERIIREVNKINRRLSNTEISGLESIRIDVDIIDQHLFSTIKELLKEADLNDGQQMLFKQDNLAPENLNKLFETGMISLSKFVGIGFEITDLGEKKVYSNLKKIESTGTTLAIKVAIYGEIICQMIDVDATIPIFIDEVGKLDDENFRSIIEHLCNRNLTPVTAKPTPTSVMPNFYHLLEKGENKILDEKNRQYNLEV
jgi:DNA repair exonuclease SbcCD ATPase subunit